MKTPILTYIIMVIIVLGGVLALETSFLKKHAIAAAQPITGNAVLTPTQALGSLGTYRINPSFRFTPQFKLEEFKQVQKLSLQLYAQVISCTQSQSGQQSLADCVQKTITDLSNKGTKLSTDCLSEEENVFYDVVESLTQCTGSISQGTCLFPLPLYKKNHQITLVPETGEEELATKKTQLLLDDTTLVITVSLTDRALPAVVDTSGTLQYCQKITLQFMGVERFMKLHAEGCNQESREYTWLYDQTIPLLKSGTTLAFVSPEMVLDPSEIIQLPDKTAYVFCMPTTHEVQVYDKIHDTISQKNISYTIAIDFSQ